MRLIQSLITAVLLLISSGSHAIYFQSLSIEHGLSQSSVFDIQQDQQGFIWIATMNGLNRYDGNTFLVFNKKIASNNSLPKLSNSYVRDIEMDKQGNFWLSTQNGLNYFDTKTFEVTSYFSDPTAQHRLASNSIFVSKLDHQGNLWIGTEKGLSFFHTTEKRFSYLPFNNSSQTVNCGDRVRELYIDNSNKVWIGGDNKGLCRYDPDTKIFTEIHFDPQRDDSQESAVGAIYQDDNGILWIGANKGLYKYNTKTGETTAYLHDSQAPNALPGAWIQDIAPQTKHVLWIATDAGLAKLDKNTNKITAFKGGDRKIGQMRGRQLFSLFIDRTGLLWIGSNDAGVDIYNPHQEVFKTITADGEEGKKLSDAAVWSLKKAYGYLWIAASNGLNRYDPTTGDIKYYFADPDDDQSIVSNVIQPITIGNNRDIWVSTREGVSRLNVDTDQFTNYQHRPNDATSIPFNHILASYLHDDGKLWLGGYAQGLAIVDFDTMEYELYQHDPLDNNTIYHNVIYSFSKGKNGTVLVTTALGVDKFDPRTKTFEHLSETTKLKELGRTENYMAVYAHSGELLIATRSGLIVFDEQNNDYFIYGKEQGLDDDVIYSIEQDSNGKVWVSTNKGLSRIDISTQEVRNFDVIDGIAGYEFNNRASFQHDGILYFGGFDGITYFNPDDIAPSATVPPIVVSSIQINDQKIENSHAISELSLSHDDVFLGFEFSALDYASTNKNQYSYMLEGFDETWNHIGTRNYASYTNLEGGHYVLKLKAANKYGVWNNEFVGLPIYVETAPWKTWWAYTFYITVLMALIVVLVRLKAVSESRVLSEKLRRVSSTLNETLDIHTIEQELSKQIQYIMPFRKLFLLLNKKPSLNGCETAVPEVIGDVILDDLDKSSIYEFLKSINRPVFIRHSAEHKALAFTSSQWCESGLLVIPLISRHKVIGGLLLFEPKQANRIKNDYINIAMTLGAQVSAALENARLYEETKQLAFYDPLTGLENRRLYLERLNQELKKIRRGRESLAVLFVDIDGFKKVNDTLGHDIGDILLAEIARRLKACVRDQDSIARIGGDEFTVLLPNVKGIDGASTAAKKILEALGQPIELKEHHINVSASIGISLAPQDGFNRQSLMRNADIAMYKAKETGRNNYQFFTKELNDKALRHHTIENLLHQALKNNEFELYYQPIVDMQTQSTLSVEALIRWHSPSEGQVPTNEFIAIAEQSSVINHIGDWVIEQACQHIAIINEKRSQPIRVMVNISTKQLHDTNIVKTFRRCIEQYKINADHMGLEITENVLIEDSENAIMVLGKLKDLGLHLAIDDFGTGYSSLSYLTQLPLDTLKIDRSFVNECTVDMQVKEITSAIIAMAKKLNLCVVAEGIETNEQLLFLQANGCSMAQGYYFCKPAPLAQLLNYLG